MNTHRITPCDTLHPRGRRAARLATLTLIAVASLHTAAWADGRLIVGGAALGSVEPGATADFVFRSVGGPIDLIVDDGAGDCPGDAVLAVHGADGELLLEDDDGGIGLCPHASGVLPAGELHVTVYGYGGQAVGPFHLRAETPGGAPDCALMAEGAALCEGDRVHFCVEGEAYTRQCPAGQRCATDIEGWSDCVAPTPSNMLDPIAAAPLLASGMLSAGEPGAFVDAPDPLARLAELDALAEGVLSGRLEAGERFVTLLDRLAVALGEPSPPTDVFADAEPIPGPMPDLAAMRLARADCSPDVALPPIDLDIDLRPAIGDLGGMSVDAAWAEVAAATLEQPELFAGDLRPSPSVLSVERVATMKVALGAIGGQEAERHAQRVQTLKRAIAHTARLQAARDLAVRAMRGEARAVPWAMSFAAPQAVARWGCGPDGFPVGGVGFPLPFDREPFEPQPSEYELPRDLLDGLTREFMPDRRYRCTDPGRRYEPAHYAIGAISGGIDGRFCEGESLTLTGTGFLGAFGQGGSVEVEQDDGRIVKLRATSWTDERIVVQLPAGLRDGTLRLRIVEFVDNVCGRTLTVHKLGNAVPLDMLVLGTSIETDHAELYHVVQGQSLYKSDTGRLTWSATDADTVAVTHITDDGRRTALGNSVAGQETLRASALADGPHRFELTASNRCRSRTVAVTVDVIHGVRPIISSVGAPGGALVVERVGAPIPLEWVASDATRLELVYTDAGRSTGQAPVDVTGRRGLQITMRRNEDVRLRAVGRIRKSPALVTVTTGPIALRTRPHIQSARLDDLSPVPYQAARRMSWASTGGSGVVVRPITGAQVTSVDRSARGSARIVANSTAASYLEVELVITNPLLPAGDPRRSQSARVRLDYRATLARPKVERGAMSVRDSYNASIRQPDQPGQYVAVSYDSARFWQSFQGSATARNGRLAVCYSTRRLAVCPQTHAERVQPQLGRTVHVIITAYNGARAGQTWHGTATFRPPVQSFWFHQLPNYGGCMDYGISTKRTRADAASVAYGMGAAVNWALHDGKCR